MTKSIVSIVLVCVFCLPTFAQEIKLNVLYTNDLHSHFEPHFVPWVSKTRKVGGFANIAARVKKKKPPIQTLFISMPEIPLPAPM